MIRIAARSLALSLLALAVPVYAAALTVTKSSSVVSDRVSLLNPKLLPGSTLDFSLLVTNPLANALAPVRSVVISDQIPAELKLRVADYGAVNSGPIEFADGDLLGPGQLGSSLSYRYAGLADTTDGVEFNNGQGWGYVPVADADGYDANVRAIRVTLSGSHAASSSFRLRYRLTLR